MKKALFGEPYSTAIKKAGFCVLELGHDSNVGKFLVCASVPLWSNVI